MNESSQIIVSKRENSGTGDSRSLRLEKKIPGIIYGDKKDPISVLLDEKILKVKIKDPTFFSKQCEIKFNDQVIKVLPKDLQLHPVNLSAWFGPLFAFDLHKVQPSRSNMITDRRLAACCSPDMARWEMSP